MSNAFNFTTEERKIPKKFKSCLNSCSMNCKIKTKVLFAMQNFIRVCIVWELCGYELKKPQLIYYAIRTDCNLCI